MSVVSLLTTIKLSVAPRSKTKEPLSKRAKVRDIEGVLPDSHDTILPEYRDS